MIYSDEKGRDSSREARHTIGLLGHGVTGTDYILNEVLEVARERGVNLLYFEGGMLHSPLDFEEQSNIIYTLIHQESVDGLIISGIVVHYAGLDGMKHLCQQYAPLPVVTQEVPVDGVPCVLLNFYQGMFDLVAHLIEEHGSRKIAFIRGPERAVSAEDRYRAYLDCLTRHNIPFSPELVAPGTFFEPSGAEAIRLFLDERKLRPSIDIDAIVAANDFMAFDAFEALQKRGIRIPEEIALIGFDNDERCRAVTPSLTTVRMQAEEMGRPLSELLLARLEGESFKEKVLLPAKIVLRESCGCQDRLVAQAAVPITRPSYPSGAFESESGIAAKRDDILAKMRDAVGLSYHGGGPAWDAHLVDGFLEELSGDALTKDSANSGPFLQALDDCLRQRSIPGRTPIIWQEVISVMRHSILPSLQTYESLVRAENLWQQARVRIAGLTQRALLCQRFQNQRQAQTLREIEHRLLITFHIDELLDVLAEELPRLAISACYLSLYEDPKAYGRSQAAPEWSRLILAYNAQGRIALAAEGQRFRSRQLVPKAILEQSSPYALGIWPLYFKDAQFGFVLFSLEGNSRGVLIYDVLRKLISNALQGDFLVQQIEKHAAELSRKQYILDAFMENIPDRIYFKDLEGRITKANKAHALRFGLTHPDEEIGKTVFDFFPEEEARTRYDQELGIIQSGRPLFNLEEETTTSDGSTLWALTTKMPLRNEHGEIVGTFGISRDISDLKQAEHDLLRYRDHLEDLVNERTQELTRSNDRLHTEILERTRAENSLRVSEQQYRMLAENVNDGIVILQNDSLVFANSTFATMVGYSTDMLLSSDPLLLLQHPALQQDHRSHEKQSGTLASEWQMELLRRNGAKIWVEIEQTAIAWNNLPASLLTIHDITNRKQQELRLEEERLRLEQENITLKSTIKERYRFGELIGKSLAMQRVYELIISAASSDVNALIYGDSGTGKELIARTIHQTSSRKQQVFVPVNCASIPETLFEREFFGHRRGAFTGADRDKPGFFDRAHRGVLFLDEVTELSPGTQAKLLRVLQDGEYTPLGSNAHKQADVLIVAATNKDVHKEIAQGRLRKDFFYRICVIEIPVPPLQDRKDDLPLLIEHLLEQYRQKQAQVHGDVPQDLPADQTKLPGEFVQGMYDYHWPGNVRELENILQRYLATQELHAVLPALGMSSRSAVPVLSQETGPSSENPVQDLTFSEAVTALEIQLIRDTLEQTHYRIGKTAKKLGMPLRTLQYKMKKYQLRLSD